MAIRCMCCMHAQVGTRGIALQIGQDFGDSLRVYASMDTIHEDGQGNVPSGIFWSIKQRLVIECFVLSCNCGYRILQHVNSMECKLEFWRVQWVVLFMSYFSRARHWHGFVGQRHGQSHVGIVVSRGVPLCGPAFIMMALPTFEWVRRDLCICQTMML